MKKKYFLFSCLMSLSLISFSCEKELSQNEVDKKNREDILKYIMSNEIQDVIEDESGLFYKIISNGIAGEHPNSSSIVSVQYKGYDLNGVIFDRTLGNEFSTFPLTNLIKGWQIGIPLMEKGSEALLLIPSKLGYGNEDKSTIPANSVLIFEIKLLDFK